MWGNLKINGKIYCFFGSSQKASSMIKFLKQGCLIVNNSNNNKGAFSAKEWVMVRFLNYALVNQVINKMSLGLWYQAVCYSDDTIFI